MAKQRGEPYIGRKGLLVYYQWRGGYYLRSCSTLTGKRFWKDKAFAGSRKRAVEFGEASKLASEVYQRLPAAMRKRGVQGRLTALIAQGIRNGMEARDAQQRLIDQFLPQKKTHKKQRSQLDRSTRFFAVCSVAQARAQDDHQVRNVLAGIRAFLATSNGAELSLLYGEKHEQQAAMAATIQPVLRE